MIQPNDENAASQSCPACGHPIDQQGLQQRIKRLACQTLGLCAALIIVGFILYVTFMPRDSMHPAAARRAECRNNLKQIGIALHNYHEVYGCFPPGYFADKTGKPLHSWRVLLLPFLDQGQLYEKYKLSEPWNGPNNRKLASEMPSIYRCPSFEHRFGQSNVTAPDNDAIDKYLTNYLAITGPGAVFSGTESRGLRHITDGTSTTIAVSEVVSMSVPWMQPQDASAPLVLAELRNSRENRELSHRGGLHILLADGCRQFLSRSIPREMFEALATVAGGEVIDEF